MCQNDDNLTMKANTAKGFATAGIVLSSILISLSFFGGGWAIGVGSAISLIGFSLIGCCCCPVDASNLKCKHFLAVAICIVGVALAMDGVVYWVNYMVNVDASDALEAGSCVGTPECFTFNQNCGEWWQDKCHCWDTSGECESQRLYCRDYTPCGEKATRDCLDENKLGGAALCASIDMQASTCLTMESSEKKALVHGGMYNWCDEDTKDWHRCKSHDEKHFAFTSLNKCQEDLEGYQEIMKAIIEVKLGFGKPVAMLATANLVCNIGVMIFGILAAFENKYLGGGDLEGGISVVTASKPRRIV